MPSKPFYIQQINPAYLFTPSNWEATQEDCAKANEALEDVFCYLLSLQDDETTETKIHQLAKQAQNAVGNFFNADLTASEIAHGAISHAL